MAQFDVFRTRGAAAYPFVVDVQADLHARLISRLVVPMIARTTYTQPTTRLTPIMRVHAEEYVVLVSLMASVPRNSLGDPVASLMQHRSTLLAAVDLLLTCS